MTSNLVVGAHAVVLINGLKFAPVLDLSYDTSTPRAELNVLDVVEPVELLPTVAHLTGQMTIYRQHRDGGLEAQGLIADWDRLTDEKYWTMAIMDRAAGGTLFRATRCSTTGQNWRVGRSYVMGLISFSGIRQRSS